MKKIFKDLQKVEDKGKFLRQLKRIRKQKNKDFKNLEIQKKSHKQDTVKLFPGLENLPNEKLITGYTIAGSILFGNRDLERILKYFKLYDDACFRFNNLQNRFKVIKQNFKPVIVKQTLMPAFKDVKYYYEESIYTINKWKEKYEFDHSVFIDYFERLHYTIWNFYRRLEDLESMIANLKKSKTNLKKNQKHR